MIYKLELDYAKKIGYKEGLEIDREEARKKIRIEIITNMVRLGYSYEEINKVFRLTMEKYLELKQDK